MRIRFTHGRARVLPVGRLVAALAAFAMATGCGDGTTDTTVSGPSLKNDVVEDVGTVTDKDTEAADTGAIATDAGGSEDAGADGGQQVLDTQGGDTQAGDTGGTDTTPVDGGSLDCPGSPGCACVENDDCDNGICLETADGKVCAKTCIDKCATGFACKQIGSTDGIFVCVPTTTSLCSPCTKNEECDVQKNGALCLDYGPAGKFCGGACKTDQDCPTDYTCSDEKGEGGSLTKQCRRKQDAGECPCSKWATTIGHTTTCSQTNEVGTCSGTRKCTATGLEPCPALVPKAETCNDVDDDCDGVTDKLPEAVTCTVASFYDEGSKNQCAADKDCPPGEGCDPATSTCKLMVGACPGTPVCVAGGKIECKDAQTPKAEQCNGADDDCDGDIDENFTWSDPLTSAAMAIDEVCGAGPCAGGKVVCETLLKATCSSLDKAAKVDSCDGVDNDCNGETDDKACEDDNQCTTDTCDGATGKCTNAPGAPCDDLEVCTNDTCDAKSGKCVFTPHTGSCDDGNACTTGDVCGLVDEKAACTAGKDAVDCDDKNVCTDDSCAPDTGCVHLPNTVTQTCFDGDPKLVGTGTCTQGVQYCVQGVLEQKCHEQVLPNPKELCDGKDDDCDGQTDTGCAAASANIAFSNAFGHVEGEKGQAYLLIGGSEPSGRVESDKQAWWAGFVHWMTGFFGG